MSLQLWTSLVLLLFSVGLSFFLAGYENFIGSPDAQRCGIDMPACPFGSYCGNGYCLDGNPSPLPPDTGLPIFP
jgi:hypothetical protein